MLVGITVLNSHMLVDHIVDGAHGDGGLVEGHEAQDQQQERAQSVDDRLEDIQDGGDLVQPGGIQSEYAQRIPDQIQSSRSKGPGESQDTRVPDARLPAPRGHS